MAISDPTCRRTTFDLVCNASARCFTATQPDDNFWSHVFRRQGSASDLVCHRSAHSLINSLIVFRRQGSACDVAEMMTAASELQKAGLLRLSQKPQKDRPDTRSPKVQTMQTVADPPLQ